MLVWTIQPKIVYEEIKTKGYFITDPKYSEYNYMYYGYKDDKIWLYLKRILLRNKKLNELKILMMKILNLIFINY